MLRRKGSGLKIVVVVQLLSCVRFFVTPWSAACQASLSFTISCSSLKLRSIESVMPFNHLILYNPLQCFPSIRVFSYESALCIRWPKYWSFSFSISPSSEYSRLTDWFDFLAVQATLKSLLQHHSSKASIFWHSAFLTVQLSHLYMTTGKHIALTIWTFVGKVMSLLFNMLCSFVTAFLPRSKHLLISRLQSPSAVILEPKKIVSLFPLFPCLFAIRWWDRMHDLSFWVLSFKPAFSLSSFTCIKRLFNSSLLSTIRVVSRGVICISEVIGISPC